MTPYDAFWIAIISGGVLAALVVFDAAIELGTRIGWWRD